VRLRGRVDANQAAVVSALRKAGASVAILANVGDGFPDLCVGLRHRNYLLEVKDGKAQLTPAERNWATRWKGQASTVRTPDEALIAVGLAKSEDLLARMK